MNTETYKLTAQEKWEQSFEFVASSIRQQAGERKGYVAAITSSASSVKLQKMVCDKLADKLNRDGKCLLIRLRATADGKGAGFDKTAGGGSSCMTAVDAEPAALRELLARSREQYDTILLELPPVRVFARGLEYARCADGVYLAERYRYALYSQFEQTLSLLRDQGMEAAGIISCR